MRWALIALLALGCGDNSPRHVYVNSGALCLRAAADDAAAGTPTLRAEVKLLGCLSSSCNRQVANACSITQNDEKITISSRLVIEPNGANCATDCGSWASRCEMPAPGAGTYNLVFGPAQGSIILPLEMDTELVADGSTRGCAPEETELGISP